MKHTAKKLSGHYEYKGYRIVRYDNKYLCDPEINGIQWNVYAPNDSTFNGSLEITSTLKEAKSWIDYTTNQEGNQK
jgi:hypothetical protein